MRRSSNLILDLTNPVSEDSEVQDLQLDTGYSLHFVLTGTLAITADVYAGNIDDASKMTKLSDVGLDIDNTGAMINVSLAQYDYFYVKLSGGTGTGTLKCYCTVKEI